MSEGRDRALDLVCIGRTSVDLYAEQEGARLEDVQSFRKYVGGSATNIAVGTARLGVKSAMLTRVGNEQMGRFVRRNLADNGVDVSRVDLRPGTPHALRPARRAGHRRLPQGLRLRRRRRPRRSRTDDVDPEFVAFLEGAAGDGHALLAGREPGGLAQGHLGGEGGREPGGLRPRLPARLLGRGLPRAGRRDVRRQRGGDGGLPFRAAGLRPRRRDRGGDPDRRRLHRDARGAPEHPRAFRRRPSCSRLARWGR